VERGFLRDLLLIYEFVELIPGAAEYLRCYVQVLWMHWPLVVAEIWDHSLGSSGSARVLGLCESALIDPFE